MASKLTNSNTLPLHRLRAATAELHNALEQITDWKRAFGSAGGYFRLLQAYREIVEPADIVVANFLRDSGNLPSGFESHIRTQWLIEDSMAVFGDSTETNEAASRQGVRAFQEDVYYPKSKTAPFDCIKSIAGAIGVQYVLEGSSLGGQMLSKQLNNALGYTPVNGGCFFAGYGDEISRRWKYFSSWANQNLISESDVVQAEQAAVYTFRCFMDSFTELANE